MKAITWREMIETLKKHAPLDEPANAMLIIGERRGIKQITEAFSIVDVSYRLLSGSTTLIVELDDENADVLAPLYLDDDGVSK